MHYEITSWSPTLADDRDVLEHSSAEKEHLVHSIRGTQKADFEGTMLNHTPKLDSSCSNQYQVWAQLDNVKSHLILSPRDIIAVLYNLKPLWIGCRAFGIHWFPSADNRYYYPVADGGKAVYVVHIQCRESRQLIINGLRPLYSLAEAVQRFIYVKCFHWANNRGKYVDGFYNPMIDDKYGHIRWPLIMITITTLRRALLQWQ